jgi:UDP-glucose 4-epimerase
MRCAVTGSSGFIGRHLVEALTRHERLGPVVAIDRDPIPLAASNVYQICADIRNVKQMTLALADCDIVFHLAAASNVDDIHIQPMLAVQNNIAGTGSVLEASRRAGVKKFVLASSVWVYMNARSDVLIEDTSLFPPGCSHLYATSKVAAEMLCINFSHQFDLPYVILRYGIPYGAYMRPELVIHRFVTQAMLGEALTIAGHGRQTREFVYIEDLIRAHLLVAERSDIKNRTYNLPGPRAISIKELAEVVQKVVPSAGGTRYVDSRDTDFIGKQVGRQLALAELGWQPEIEIEEGIKRSYHWLKSQAVHPSLMSSMKNSGRSSNGNERRHQAISRSL